MTTEVSVFFLIGNDNLWYTLHCKPPVIHTILHVQLWSHSTEALGMNSITFLTPAWPGRNDEKGIDVLSATVHFLSLNVKSKGFFLTLKLMATVFQLHSLWKVICSDREWRFLLTFSQINFKWCLVQWVTTPCPWENSFYTLRNLKWTRRWTASWVRK